MDLSNPLHIYFESMKLIKISSKVLFSVAVISLLLYSQATPITSQEIEEHEEEFNYVEGSERGPSNWGNLREDWETCSIGRLQSPVDMSFENVAVIDRPGHVFNNYKPANATIENRGHDIIVAWAGNKAGSILINRVKYFLLQCHWHSPSEHTINGRRFDLELHVVHQSPAQNRIAVFGLLYNIGPSDPFLSRLLPSIKSLNDQTKKIDIGRFDPDKIGVNTREFYRYIGSLTTPPCTEGVIWSVNNVIRTVSPDQLHALRKAVHYESNARPLQPLDGRKIILFDPMSGDASY